MFDVIIAGGRVVDGTGLPWYRADVGLRGDKIAAVGNLQSAKAKIRIDAADDVVAPGFIDAHVHGDIVLLADPLHEPAIRQGVTTYIVGQDGVAMAPASPTTLAYMRRYTAGFSGTFPIGQRWSSVAEYLACFDNRCALNIAYLIPNGNVRMEVMGPETRPPTADELKTMRRLVHEGMEQGAIGLSTGLDYIPSRYADTEELIELCKEIAPFDGIYVTHMRRYDAEGLYGSMDEVYRIGQEAGCGVHISHFNSRADLVEPKLESGRKAGVDVTFDLYCYMAGSTILAMVALPPEVQVGGIEPTIARLKDPSTRDRLEPWFQNPPYPLETMRLGFVASEAFRHYEGMTLDRAAAEAKKPVGDFVVEVLLASDLAVSAVVPHTRRTIDDMRRLMVHPLMMAGSDGIYTGSHPHPRGWGCFARYLGQYVREEKCWSLEQAVQHLSAHAARRFNLKDRGFIREGLAADVVVFDPDTIADRSTYENGRQEAVGMKQVVVNGQFVLHNGERTSALPGRGLKGR